MRRSMFSPALSACLLMLSGCLSSAMPLAGDTPGETDLAGHWTAIDTETRIPLGMQMFLKKGLEITRHSDSYYDLSVGDHDYEVEVSRVGDDLYLDVSPLVEVPDDESPPLTLPLHVFLRYEQTDDTLQVYPWDVSAWNAAISSRKLPVIRPERENTVLVMRSHRLKALIKEDRTLFQQQPVTFRRKREQR